jgi:hypothetical protein
VRFSCSSRTVSSASVSYIRRSGRKLEDQFRSMQLHIAYLRGLDDSGDTRAACVRYLQNNYQEFYPERPDCSNRQNAWQ